MAYENDRFSDYVDVAERIRIFRERYPDGALQPLDPSQPFQIVEVGGQTFIQYTAVAYKGPGDQLPGIAVSWEPFPGKTPYTAGSELMNAETAAWGRAIVAALAADTKKIASLDEVRARREARETGHPSASEHHDPERARRAASEPVERPSQWPEAEPATQPQERALYAISKKLGKLPPPKGSLTKSVAGKLIETLQAELDARPADTEEPF